MNFTELYKLFSPDNPLSTLILGLGILYFAVIVFGNIRSVWEEVFRDYRAVEIEKTRLEILKLKVEILKLSGRQEQHLIDDLIAQTMMQPHSRLARVMSLSGSSQEETGLLDIAIRRYPFGSIVIIIILSTIFILMGLMAVPMAYLSFAAALGWVSSSNEF